MQKLILLFLALLSFQNTNAQSQKELFASATKKTTSKDYAGAIEIYNQIIAKDEKNEKALLLRGNCSDTLGDDLAAFRDFSKVIELNKKSEYAFIGRGSLVYLPDGNLKFRLNEALEDINNAINLNPKNPLSYTLRGEIKQIMTNYKLIDKKEPLLDFELSLKLKPNDIRTLNNVARFYDSQGDYANAYTFYQKSLTVKPDQAPVYYSMAWIKKAIDKDTLLALQYFSTSIKLDPAFAPNYVERGRIFCGKKDYIKGIEDYNTAIRLDSNNYDALYDRAIAEINSEKYKLALPDLSKIINRVLKAKEEKVGSSADYFYGSSLYYRGFAHYYLEKKDDACKDWREAAINGIADAKRLVTEYCN